MYLLSCCRTKLPSKGTMSCVCGGVWMGVCVGGVCVCARVLCSGIPSGKALSGLMSLCFTSACIVVVYKHCS